MRAEIRAGELLAEMEAGGERHKGNVRLGSWLRENSEIEFTNGNFLSTSINLENKSAGDGCRDKTIKKTILRALRARTFSRGLGQNRANVFRCSPNNGHRQDTSACPFRAKSGSRRSFLFDHLVGQGPFRAGRVLLIREDPLREMNPSSSRTSPYPA
jgi:hypothetical protein